MEKVSKILLVDDDGFMLTMVGRLLSARGFNVTVADTAVAILDTVAEYTPDVIIMDNEMPVVSGHQAILELKSNSNTRGIPIIYFSSVYNLAELARNAGADAYLSKTDILDNIDDIIRLIDQLKP